MSFQKTDNQISNDTNLTKEVNALLVIDVQNCFITGGLALSDSPARENGADVVPIINDLIKTVPFDFIVYSHDWHPQNHISFFANLESRRQYLEGNQSRTLNEFDPVVYTGPKERMEQVLWPTHCVQNKVDAQLHKDLIVNPLADNVIHIQKGVDPDIDSYSAFWDNNKYNKTELDSKLKERNVTTVFVAGLATDYCVAATSLDAYDLNYTTYLIEDACRGVDPDTIAMQKDKMKQRGIIFIQSNEVKSYVSSGTFNQNSFIIIIFFLFSSFIYE